MELKIEVLPQPLTVCKLLNFSPSLLDEPLCFLCKTDLELSLVCTADAVPKDCISREDGWRAFRICGQLEFSLVGILAKISTILAQAQVGLFAVSTYDTDYILVKEFQLDAAVAALQKEGISCK
jgi:hypothetical protein